MTGSAALEQLSWHQLCFALTFLSIVPAAQAGGTEASRTQTIVGRHISDFMLPDTAGKQTALHDLVEKVGDKGAVIVYFMGVDCPISNLYLKELAALARRYENRGVRDRRHSIQRRHDARQSGRACQTVQSRRSRSSLTPASASLSSSERRERPKSSSSIGSEPSATTARSTTATATPTSGANRRAANSNRRSTNCSPASRSPSPRRPLAAA